VKLTELRYEDECKGLCKKFKAVVVLKTKRLYSDMNRCQT